MKQALVTGAAGGIGSATCELLSREGYEVVGLDRQSRPPETPASAWIQADLREVVKAWREGEKENLEEILGLPETEELDLLVNNAAVQRLAPVEDMTSEDWEETLDVNLTAPLALVRLLLPRLTRANGCVVNVTSIHTKLTKPGFVAYAASKSALEGLTRALAVDLGQRVRVNAVSPAAIDTPLLEGGLSSGRGRGELADKHPVGRIGSPEEVAAAIVYLAQAGSAFTTGTILDVSGGIHNRLHDIE